MITDTSPVFLASVFDGNQAFPAPAATGDVWVWTLASEIHCLVNLPNSWSFLGEKKAFLGESVCEFGPEMRSQSCGLAGLPLE